MRKPDLPIIEEAIAEARLARLDDERRRILGEIKSLNDRRHLVREATPVVPDFPHAKVTNQSPPEEKITLFQSLFRRREYVYARRRESLKTGKSGYQPACKNEWLPGLCGKPAMKCGECPFRDYLPVTSEVLHHHLSGYDSHAKTQGAAARDFTIGVYPLLPDETCRFLALDFDKKEWRQYVSAFMDVCRQMDVPVALERSPVVITERKEHLHHLADRLSRFARNVIVMKGGEGARQRKAIAEKIAGIPDGEERLIIAPGRYLGEGFDDPRLDTLFLTLPISWKGRSPTMPGVSIGCTTVKRR